MSVSTIIKVQEKVYCESGYLKKFFFQFLEFSAIKKKTVCIIHKIIIFNLVTISGQNYCVEKFFRSFLEYYTQ